MRFILKTLIIVYALSGANVFSQKIIEAIGEYNFVNFSLDKGLDVANVNQLYQDKKGYIWVCGRSGVAKFDGLKFEEYSSKNGLPSGGAGSIAEDHHGNIWFGTWKGIAVLKNNKFILDTSKGMPRFLSWDMLTDSDGTIWSANHEGIFHFDPDKPGNSLIKHYRIASKDQNNAFRGIFRNKKGELIFGAEIGCFILRDDSLVRYLPDGLPIYTFIELDNGIQWVSGWGTSVYQYKDCKMEKLLDLGAMVLDMVKDNDGNVYLVTWDKGVLKYDGEKFVQFTVKNGLPINSFWSALCDHENNIWFGTWGQGICKFSGEKITKLTEKSGLLNNYLNSIDKDEEGNLWFGSQNGLSKFNLKSRRIEKFELATDKGLYNQIMKIKCINKDEIWCPGYGGTGFKFIKGKFVNSPGFAGYYVLYDSKKRVWFSAENSLFLLDAKGEVSKEYEVNTNESGKLHSMFEDHSGNIWVANYRKGINLLKEDSLINLDADDGLSNTPATAIVQYLPNKYFIALSGKGIFNYHYNNGRFRLLDSITVEDGLLTGGVSSFYIKNDVVYAAGVNGLSVFNFDDYKKGNKKINTFSEDEGLNGNYYEINFVDSSGGIWMQSNKGAFRFDPEIAKSNVVKPLTHITNLSLFFENINWKDYCDSIHGNLPVDLVLPYNKNHLTFSFIGISFTAPSKIKFKYKLAGYDNNWSPYMTNNQATFSNISPGTYTFMVIASYNGIEASAEPICYSFTIKPPFWRTYWFYTLSAIFIFLLGYLYTKARMKKLRAEKKLLETKVLKRTAQLKDAFYEIEQKNKEITDSINYSRRIQKAILPEDAEINASLPSNFVIYQPKDIVSGDFYYFQKTDKGCFIAVVDCTGHGVPGAFMSLLGKENLDKAVEVHKRPTEILAHLNRGVKKSLKQNKEDSTRDGMDIALCYIDNNKLVYSGANRPLIILRSTGELVEVKPVKCSIGGLTEDFQEFEEHEFHLNKGDVVYIYSDGYADQFGGEKMKKITTKTLKQLLSTYYSLPMDAQKEALENYLTKWKGNNEQIDDVCLIGIKF